MYKDEQFIAVKKIFHLSELSTNINVNVYRKPGYSEIDWLINWCLTPTLAVF